MEQYGYEVKHGKHIAFKKMMANKRFTRAMRIGKDYPEERLKERILEEVDMKGKRPKAPFKPLDNVIDISVNDKAKALLDTNIGQQSIICLLWQILLTRLEVKVLKHENNLKKPYRKKLLKSNHF